jgi:hypothetical protein
MTAMTLHPNFHNRARPDAVRVRFAFGVSGDHRVGTLYINADVPPGADMMAEAAKAAKIARKRAGAATAELYSISNPTR